LSLAVRLSCRTLSAIEVAGASHRKLPMLPGFRSANPVPNRIVLRDFFQA